MCVIRDRISGKITTDWYVKPMASGRLLSYKSYHPLNQKLGMVRGLIHRVFSLCSPEYYEKNMKRILDILMANEYPKQLIKRLINNRSRRTNDNSLDSSANSSSARSNVVHRSLLYVPGVSDRIKRSIEKATDKISVAFKCFNTLGSIFSRLKDKLPLMSSSHVVFDSVRKLQ